MFPLFYYLFLCMFTHPVVHYISGPLSCVCFNYVLVTLSTLLSSIFPHVCLLIYNLIFMFCWPASLYNLLNNSKALIYLFISLLYMFRASVCPSSGEKLLYLCETWYLSLCMDGVWSAGWIFNPTSRPDATHTERQIPVSHKRRYSHFLLMMGAWMPETYTEQK